MNQLSTYEKLDALATRCSGFGLPASALLRKESIEVLYQQKKRQMDSEATANVAETAVATEQERRQTYYDGHEYQTLISQH
ncbi:hypothetical protein OAD57_09235 [Porticoccaceae bacterium]|nr:hypothetical protein [Porticoccaceae bacterium]